jgi:hypothetical protein
MNGPVFACACGGLELLLYRIDVHCAVVPKTVARFICRMVIAIGVLVYAVRFFGLLHFQF